jgi:hypothetical protein
LLTIPFEQIPGRVFLDTNIINLIVKHGGSIFEGEPLQEGIDSTAAHDIEALMHIFYVGSRAHWDILGSPKTMEELSKTKDTTLRQSLLGYALEIINQDATDEDVAFAMDFGRRLKDCSLVSALPDEGDRELIGNAIGFGCDAFVTCDRATIINKRSRLRALNLRLLTPAEWWAHIRPWAALWC